MLQPASVDAESLDAAALRRLLWRARRGLLENDLILGRFFARYAQTLSTAEWKGLQDLLELDDNTLLELLLGHAEPPPKLSGEAQLRVLHLLRAV